MGLLLSIIAPILFLILTIPSILVVVWKNARTKGFWKTVNGYFMQSAKNIDIFGNSNYRTLFNTLLRKPHGYEFGTPNETISSALGKNQRDKTLSFIGWVIVYVLWCVDYTYWNKGGHCINAIN
jgi:hypothetical protein